MQNPSLERGRDGKESQLRTESLKQRFQMEDRL